MTTKPMTWAVVLAGGDGTRLSTLTRDSEGIQVPKQYWSLSGGNTLVQDAIERARHVAPPERICAIVAKSHRRHWSGKLVSVDASNIIVQPRNCGTAIGILLATLSIAKRDPTARIVFFPADHYVGNEALLATGIRETAAVLATANDSIALLGIKPECIDCELGYIIPGATDSAGTVTVTRFVEKPGADLAKTLLATGAVWNSFIFASGAQTLVDVMHQHMPRAVVDMRDILQSQAEASAADPALQGFYKDLLPIDFSRTVLQQSQEALRLVTAPACGWTDLGTPNRVAKVLTELQCNASGVRHPPPDVASGVRSLATQFKQLGVGT